MEPATNAMYTTIAKTTIVRIIRSPCITEQSGYYYHYNHYYYVCYYCDYDYDYDYYYYNYYNDNDNDYDAYDE